MPDKIKRIHVASLNKNKIIAVKEAFPSYIVEGISCISGVREQPIGLPEIIKGAIFRARSVFGDCEFSVGIEDGIAEVPETISGYMNFCCCAIYDGKRIYPGLGPAFEYPPVSSEKVVTEGVTISEAFSSISRKPDIGYEEGIIGWLTKGRINRKDYTKIAVEMARIQIDNPELY
ncbi:MAG: inosine/xanthosine triphosphatase [Candidatus Methanoperedens sp.]|nr:inosine/xanthosine triphosphatase [Candidatus Methanoperedens sp.]MCE8424515.1 inosine/xanthosine triphosphatase [Candidatus Methanoperedens sp.]MCE8426943.1 inosine/xanthosine triphosphatase [Candidatus Methanoperedens sp.]